VELDAAGNYSVLLGSTKNEGVPAELFGANDLRWLAGEIQCAGCGGRPARIAGKRALCIEGSGCRHAGRQTGSGYMTAATAAATTAPAVAAPVKRSARPDVVSGTLGYIPYFYDTSSDLGIR
jgi:hypothetical protein